MYCRMGLESWCIIKNCNKYEIDALRPNSANTTTISSIPAVIIIEHRIDPISEWFQTSINVSTPKRAPLRTARLSNPPKGGTKRNRKDKRKNLPSPLSFAASREILLPAIVAIDDRVNA